MESLTERPRKAIELISAILADRLVELLIPDADKLLGKLGEETAAAVIAVFATLWVSAKIFSRPQVVIEWNIVSAPAEGPVIQLPPNGYVGFAGTFIRQGVIAKWALNGRTEIPFDIQTEPSGALKALVERAAPLGASRTVSPSLVRTTVRCTHNGQQVAVTLRLDGSAAPTSVNEVAVACRLAPGALGRRGWALRIESPVKTIRW